MAKDRIRISRVIGLVGAVSLGTSIATSIGIFILPGVLLQAYTGPIHISYLLTILVLLPVLLTLMESSVATPGSGGLFNLARVHDSVLATYGAGWALLGGYLAISSILAWGCAHYLAILIDNLFNYSIPLNWIAVGILVILGMYELVGTRENWFARTIYLIGRSAILITIIVWGLLRPAGAVSFIASTAPATNVWTFIPWIVVIGWSIEFVVSHRDAIRNPQINIPRALLIPILLTSVLGSGVVYLLTQFPGLFAETPVPLALLSMQLNPVFGVFFLLAMIALLLHSLNQALVNGLRLAGELTREGFLPGIFARIPTPLGTPFISLVVAVIGSSLAVSFIDIDYLFGIAVGALFLTILIVVLPSALKRKPPLPEPRPIVLPMHPVIPMLASAICAILLVVLPLPALLIGLGWLLLGVAIYFLHAREHAIDIRQKSVLVGDVTHEPAYQVLVGIANPATAPSIIQTGVRFARKNQGELLALQVLVLPEQMPAYQQRATAQTAWEKLRDIVEGVDTGGINVRPLVRIAPDPASGILETAWEEKVDLILLGWPGGNERIPMIVQTVVRRASARVAILHGTLPETIKKVLVPVGNVHATTALNLGQDLLADGGNVTAMDLVIGPLTADREIQSKARLEQTITPLETSDNITPKTVQTANRKRRILKESESSDIVIMGVTTDDFLEGKIFGGIPVDVAQSSNKPTLLVKRYEEAHRFWWRRLLQEVTNIIPSLTVNQQANVYLSMHRDSKATIDFYIMIVLASAIAYFGLLQGSPAVIIGGMLVAPLMSPMMAMAHGIAQGNLLMFRQASGSTVRGILLSIGISTIFTLLINNTAPLTTEILSRTQPNVLDMLVALVSGAAAAYALSREDVAAALPGVAIAAALVPPLCVIGYGLGAARFDIAGGATLLFLTNLASIILAGAAIFLLLGFRPTRAERVDQVRRSLVFAVIALVVIGIPLTIASVQSIQRERRQAIVQTILDQEVSPEIAEIEDVSIATFEDGFAVRISVYLYSNDPEALDITRLQTQMIESIGAPVYLRARVIDASLTENQIIRSTPPPKE